MLWLIETERKAERTTVMSQIVKCEVCGGVYNRSHLSAHQRLSHGLGKTSNPTDAGEPQKLETVLLLYNQLSEKGKEKVRNQLESADRHLD